MPGRGFTISILPHSGRPQRRFEVSGAGLTLLKVGIVLAVLVVAAAAVLVSSWSGAMARAAMLEDRVEDLRDSLSGERCIEARLDSIEACLEEIREMRRRIEILAETADPSGG